MCLSKPKVDNSALEFQKQESARARAEETARQARISEGMRQIAAIFDGGEFAPALDPLEAVQVTEIENPAYAEALAQQRTQGVRPEHSDGRHGGGLSPETFGPLPPRLIPSVPGATVGDFVIPDNIRRGETQTFAGLQPVLDQRRAALEGFLVPQLDKQFGDAKDDLTFALARSGQLTSSTAGTRQGDLSEAFALNRADIDSQIQGDVSSTRNRINQQRQSLEAALRASGDQTATTNNALATATTFRQETPSLSPLGNLFGGLATGIGAVQQGFENGRITRLATPNPLGNGTGRVVRT